MFVRRFVAALASLVALSAHTAFAQCEYATLVQQVIASDPTGSARLGASVAVDGTTIVAGAPLAYRVSGGPQTGAVYVYTRSGNFVTQQQKLVASDGALNDLFGSSVALVGNTLIVGAPGYASGRGAVYVFVRSGSTWTQQAKLASSDIATGDAFGTSLALTTGIQRWILVVGAPNDDNVGPAGSTGGSNAGSAYVFTASTLSVNPTWSQAAKLMATDGSAGDNLGTSVSASGTTAVIGAPNDSPLAGFGAGSAYVFTGDPLNTSNWSQQVRLLPNNGVANGRFGQGISYESNTALIGAYNQEGFNGGFYVFTRSGTIWTQAQYFPAASTRDGFGGNLALDGDLAAVGSYPYEGQLAQRPPIRLYRRVAGVWTFVNDIPTIGNQTAMGAPVALSGSTIVTSATLFSTQTLGAVGTAYVFDLTSGPATEIDAQPTSMSVCLGEAASFDVQATGSQLAYRWQYLTAPNTFTNLADGETSLGSISGATSPNLVFTANQSHVVRCELTGACGVVNSNQASLTVRASDDPVCTGEPVCPGCAADYDQDGGVTGADIGAFFVDFESGAACADVDLDGGVTGGDIGAFFVVYEGGGC